MILEGLVTTRNADGTTNVSPMGPRVATDMRTFTLRPFQSSTTYQNLLRHGEGVLHVTDDVELLAAAAIGRVQPPLAAIVNFPIPRLADTCRWYAFRVTLLDNRQERTTIQCEVVASGCEREFFGFNRAKHAVLEGAIMSTRIGIVPDEEIRREFARWSVIVGKTAGDSEQRAWRMLLEYVDKRLSSS